MQHIESVSSVEYIVIYIYLYICIYLPWPRVSWCFRRWKSSSRPQPLEKRKSRSLVTFYGTARCVGVKRRTARGEDHEFIPGASHHFPRDSRNTTVRLHNNFSPDSGPPKKLSFHPAVVTGPAGASADAGILGVMKRPTVNQNNAK